MSRSIATLSNRQWRLLACACAARVPAAARGSSGEAIELAARFADGQATAHQLASARFGGRFQPGHAGWAVCWATGENAARMAERALAWALGSIAERGVPGDWGREKEAQRHLHAEIAGPSEGRSAIDPAWLAYDGGQVGKLARSIYDARSWELMAILGDALEEAGCSAREWLGHCRDGTDHVRGCWLLDALLGLK